MKSVNVNTYSLLQTNYFGIEKYAKTIIQIVSIHFIVDFETRRASINAIYSGTSISL